MKVQSQFLFLIPTACFGVKPLPLKTESQGIVGENPPIKWDNPSILLHHHVMSMVFTLQLNLSICCLPLWGFLFCCSGNSDIIITVPLAIYLMAIVTHACLQLVYNFTLSTSQQLKTTLLCYWPLILVVQQECSAKICQNAGCQVSIHISMH